jgi:hypothetical protein
MDLTQTQEGFYIQLWRSGNALLRFCANPINRSDPSGRDWMDDARATGAPLKDRLSPVTMLRSVTFAGCIQQNMARHPDLVWQRATSPCVLDVV